MNKPGNPYQYYKNILLNDDGSLAINSESQQLLLQQIINTLNNNNNDIILALNFLNDKIDNINVGNTTNIFNNDNRITNNTIHTHTQCDTLPLNIKDSCLGTTPVTNAVNLSTHTPRHHNRTMTGRSNIYLGYNSNSPFEEDVCDVTKYTTFTKAVCKDGRFVNVVIPNPHYIKPPGNFNFTDRYTKYGNK